jgi:tetratricopeptide (TPR) repeat protein
VADHYQYSAAIGLIAVAAAAASQSLAKTGLLPAFQAGLLLLLGCLTWQQCGIYRDAETLWRDTVAKNPDSWMAHHNLGSELFERNQLDEALEHFQAAVALHPNGDVEQGDLGLALMEKGLDSQAIPHLEAALAINPRLFPAQNNLAMAYANTGNWEQSVAHYQLALQLNTNAPGTVMNLAAVFQKQGRLDEAIRCYRQLTAQYPAEVEPWRRLAAALAAAGHSGEAIAACQRGLQTVTNRSSLLLDLGNAYFQQTNYQAAANCFRDALKSEPDNAGLHYNLGVVSGLLGDPAAERAELQTALQLQPGLTAARQRLQRLPP